MEINFTLLIQVGIYLTLFFILKAFYFKPILALLKKREALTVGKRDQAAEITAKLKSLRVEFDSRMKEAHEAIEKNRSSSLEKFRKTADEKIHEAKTKTEKTLWAYQDSLEKEAAGLRGKMNSMANELQKEIVGAMTGSRVVRL